MRSPQCKKSRILISIDPSFHGFGLSIYEESDSLNGLNNKLFFIKLSCDQKIKSFQDAYIGTKELMKEFNLILDYFVKEYHLIKEFVFEIPPVGGSFAPGLFMLNAFMVDTMLSRGFTVAGVSCKLCRSVVGIPKVKKEILMPDFINDYFPNLRDVIEIAEIKIGSGKPVLNSLAVHKYRVRSHDISESLIIMFTYAHIKGWGQKAFPKFEKFCSKPFIHFNLFEIKGHEKWK